MNYESLKNRYSKYYCDLQYSNGNGMFSRFFHTQMERDLHFESFEYVLEVGAGSGEHFEYVKHQFNQYIISDLVLPNLSSTLKHMVSLRNSKAPVIQIEAQDAQRLKYPDSSFNRVIMTCLLHHVNEPLEVLTEARRVISNGGLISIYLPSDPGILYRLAQRLISTQSFKKYFEPGEIAFLRACEHRNHVGSLLGMIVGVFEHDIVKKKTFPRIGFGWNTTLFQVLHIQVSK